MKIWYTFGDASCKYIIDYVYLGYEEWKTYTDLEHYIEYRNKDTARTQNSTPIEATDELQRVNIGKKQYNCEG